MILLIDNYDSFAYNLFQLVGEINPEIKVIRNDSLTVKEIFELKPEKIILSPGPGRPENAGVIMEVVGTLGKDIPIFGVCLGHQAICAAIGIDGLILPDVPFEEKNEFLPTCKKFDVDLISMIASEAEGFLYIVSSLVVTGIRNEIVTDLAPIIKIVRENTNIPCAIGFGISSPEQAKKMAELSDGAIVGSAIIKILAQHGKNSALRVGKFVREMVYALETVEK